jgi:uncharacterized delta-60 repeat protein
MKLTYAIRFVSVVLSLFVVLHAVEHAVAAPGGLDYTFSGDGKIIDGIVHGYDDIRGVAVQPDGKIVVAGVSSTGNWNRVFSVARYTADGSLDSSFGNGGSVLTSIGPYYQEATSVAIQSDGKIVVAGWIYDNSNDVDFAVVRYNPDGSLDNSFDGDGKVITFFSNGGGRAQSVAVQSNGKIVVAGYASIGASGNLFAVVRYDANGSLDPTFDGDGIATTDVLPGSYDEGYSVTIQADGKLDVAGRARTTDDSTGNFDFAVVRYNADGTLDNTFDGDGKATTAIGPRDDYARSITIQPDGKIVAAGSVGNASFDNFDFALVRYNTNGSLDTSFDGDGKVTTSIGPSQDNGLAVLIQTDEKIVVSGSSFDGTTVNFAVVRYNPNGALDPFFDLDGKVTTSLGQGFNEARAAAIQPNGRIIAAGVRNNVAEYDYGIVRYNVDGSLDPSFGSGGTVVTDFGFFEGNSLNSTAIQPDGKIVAVGDAALNGFAVVRYNPDGSPDVSFGGNGKALIPLSNWTAYDMALQPDGKIVLTGYENDSNGAAIARLNSNGSLDNTFDGDGMITNVFSAGSIAVQQDGKIVVQANNYSLVRYNSDGSVDPTFTNTGSTWGNIIIQPDGKIVLAGSQYGDADYDFAVVRYNSNGALDATFGSNGMVVTSVGGDDFASSAAIQADGKIVVAGSSRTGQNPDFAVVRYNPNGSLDTTFDTDGKVVTSLGPGYDYGTAICVEADGKIVVSGTTEHNSGSDFGLARYTAQGSLDTTFGAGDGIAILDFDNSNDFSSGMVLDAEGRAVVVGRADGAFAIARFRLGANRTRFDFDGDGRTDVSVFRPSNSVWYLDRSTDGFTAVQFGLPTDKIAPADYDGDGKTDIAVFRDGTWWLIKSSTNTAFALSFGQVGDVPVSADYTGDGRDEIAVYRNGQWWSYDLRNGNSALFNFGLAADRPVPGDYNGDGLADHAVYRNGEWHINRSQQGYAIVAFGLASDRPVTGDYDGDGKDDLAVYRDGIWHVLQSSLGYKAFQWGTAADIPTPADYDGDGKTDPAVFRNGVWYVNQTGSGISIRQFGLANDKPVASAYLP